MDDAIYWDMEHLQGEKRMNADFIHGAFEVLEIYKWKMSNKQLDVWNSEEWFLSRNIYL